MNYQNILKKLEQELKGIDLKLAGYLHCRRNYRITDMDTILKNGIKEFRKKVKSNKDLQFFLHYHYYLGKWAAYQYVLEWLILNWHKKENKTFLSKLKL